MLRVRREDVRPSKPDAFQNVVLLLPLLNCPISANVLLSQITEKKLGYIGMYMTDYYFRLLLFLGGFFLMFAYHRETQISSGFSQ